MKDIIIKIVCGILFSIIGFAIFTLLIEYIFKPNNAISLDFSSPIHNYFFVFSYGLGVVGTIFGAIILAGIIGILFFAGFWISGKMLLQLNIRKWSRAV